MNKETPVQVLDAVQALKLGPDDILIYRAHRPISADTANRVKEFLLRETGHQKVLVLDTAGQLEVLRPEPTPSLTAKLSEFLWRRRG